VQHTSHAIAGGYRTVCTRYANDGACGRSVGFAVALSNFPVPCAQIPPAITVLETGLYHSIPLEVAWWWLCRCGVQPGAWVAVVSNNAALAAALAVRAGTGLNLLWGLTELEMEDVGELDPYVQALKTQVKVADGLPPVQWDQGVR
jgi:hypothetical protein